MNRTLRWVGLSLALLIGPHLSPVARSAPPAAPTTLPDAVLPSPAPSPYLPSMPGTLRREPVAPAQDPLLRPYLPPGVYPPPGPLVAPPGGPPVLDRSLVPDEPPLPEVGDIQFPGYAMEPHPGYSGPSGVLPTVDATKDFVPMEDRWRHPYSEWDRYNNGNPPVDDIPFELGNWYDPYNLNVLKGDYPIYGQHTFMALNVSSFTLTEYRTLPTSARNFESTARPNQLDFFGRPNQFVISEFLRGSVEFFHGDTAAFKPKDWAVRLTPIFNVNTFNNQEIGVVNPDVRKGAARQRTWFALEEYFAEYKLADLSPEYDFVSLRVGSQPFNSDFRGFIFSDINTAARLFGTLNGNRDQFNLAIFRQREKDINSLLNTFDDRRQNIFIANYYRQDFLFPGYTMEASLHYDNDLGSVQYDKNNFLVRPDPAGVSKVNTGSPNFARHTVDAVYLGLAGDGHVGRYNITHAFYWALGRDSLNRIANQEQDINAQFAAIEGSYDRDWARFRTSFMWASGDGNVNNSHATGFDSILDNPQFAGGQFSYFQRQAIPLFGVALTQRNSFLTDLRSNKVQGQANFVNPGLMLINGGFDLDLTPKFRVINNLSYLQFDKTNALETFLFAGGIKKEIGFDLSTGFEYRPLLSNNVILMGGLATLIPGQGFKALYSRFEGSVNPLYSAFFQATLAY